MLLTSYGSSNRVITNDKTVSYSMKRVNGKWEYVKSALLTITYDWMWEFHRYCQKTYSYVGMDLATANACAEAMIAKYTRAFYISSWNGDTGQFEVVYGGSVPMAEVAVQQRAGCMYDVVINVREDDARLDKEIPRGGIPSLFTAENNRNYD